MATWKEKSKRRRNWPIEDTLITHKTKCLSCRSDRQKHMPSRIEACLMGASQFIHLLMKLTALQFIWTVILNSVEIQMSQEWMPPSLKIHVRSKRNASKSICANWAVQSWSSLNIKLLLEQLPLRTLKVKIVRAKQLVFKNRTQLCESRNLP